MRNVTFTTDAWEDYIYWQSQYKKPLRRINELIKSAQRTPFDGVGKPEALRENLAGFWSRRIDEANRLVYEVSDSAIAIISCRYHYRLIETMFDYPVILTPDEGTVLVTFPDVPEAITFGVDEDEALLHAVDALETGLSFYVDARKSLPAVSQPAPGQKTVRPSALECAKLDQIEAAATVLGRHIEVTVVCWIIYRGLRCA